MPRTFVSYASEYDSHVGHVPMTALTREKQDELVRLMFDPQGDSDAFVMENDVLHAQPDGLWAVIVAVGLRLERAILIRDFMERTPTDTDWILSFLSGTNLWLRLEEALPPFSDGHHRTDYDWSELEPFAEPDTLADLNDEDLIDEVRAYLSKPRPPEDGAYLRMPYQEFHREYEAGRLVAYVDRGMAVQVFRFAPSLWSIGLPLLFLLGLLAFLPVMIFVSIWAGLGTLALAIIARRMLTVKAVDWVRKDALSNRERFRWYSARSIVWARRTTPRR